MIHYFKGGKAMIYSNERKLCLSGWLKENSETSYNTPLKLQKFLLLYEAFAKSSGEKPDFDHLRGYKKGPVFSNVWGDYTKERAAFNAAAVEAYNAKKCDINIERAKKCAFVVRTMTETELSELTHKMNLWKSKEARIMRGEYNVDLYEKDFNEDDESMMRMLDEMYPVSMIDDSVIIHLDKNYFVFSEMDSQKLTEEHFDTLMTLAEQEDLHNPVYVDIDAEGRLLVD